MTTKALFKLAGRAIAKNLTKVWVGFEGGGDLPAPIGWLIHFSGVDDAHLAVYAQRGSAIHAWTPDGPLDETGITAWIDANAGPVAVSQEIQQSSIELMESAVTNGWDFSREIMSFAISDHAYASITYQFHAVNWFYNTVGHEQHRDTGADLSRTFAVGYPNLAQPEVMWALDGADRVDVADVFARVHQLTPWHSPVARYDEDAEEWVL